MANATLIPNITRKHFKLFGIGMKAKQIAIIVFVRSEVSRMMRLGVVNKKRSLASETKDDLLQLELIDTHLL
ncbi:hypothetical protein Bhyg_10408 [Pseudolycoriella hygida]|uniref:Uncharacterized protein n=1 Tax=Pseudolycoriella hygida TaxID=35572 RepID=A0A9Q0MW56_9DIPT|nr:hypothetical protein Bhyg_10408 [Pseudolycoriella hygida]